MNIDSSPRFLFCNNNSPRRITLSSFGENHTANYRRISSINHQLKVSELDYLRQNSSSVSVIIAR